MVSPCCHSFISFSALVHLVYGKTNKHTVNNRYRRRVSIVSIRNSIDKLTAGTFQIFIDNSHTIAERISIRF